MSLKLISQKPEVIETIVCEKHGPFQPRVEPFPLGNRFIFVDACPECSKEENERERLTEEAERKARFDKKILSEKFEAGLNKRHIECTFENYRTNTAPKELALNKVKAYLEGVISGKSNCLVMAGKVGTGKTHLAAAIVNQMIERGKSCQLIKMCELIRSVKATWSKFSEISEQALLDKYSTIDLLIVDEIGIQFGSDTEKLLLSEIIDNRYQEMLPTVLISNLELSEIKDFIGTRSYDRLKQDGGKVVAFDWESER